MRINIFLAWCMVASARRLHHVEKGSHTKAIDSEAIHLSAENEPSGVTEESKNEKRMLKGPNKKQGASVGSAATSYLRGVNGNMMTNYNGGNPKSGKKGGYPPGNSQGSGSGSYGSGSQGSYGSGSYGPKKSAKKGGYSPGSSQGSGSGSYGSGSQGSYGGSYGTKKGNKKGGYPRGGSAGYGSGSYGSGSQGSYGSGYYGSGSQGNQTSLMNGTFFPSNSLGYGSGYYGSGPPNNQTGGYFPGSYGSGSQGSYGSGSYGSGSQGGYIYSKGAKSAKKSKGAKGSKKAAPKLTGKKNKKTKPTKKSVDKKLKNDGNPYGTWMPGMQNDKYISDNFWSDGIGGTASPIQEATPTTKRNSNPNGSMVQIGPMINQTGQTASPSSFSQPPQAYKLFSTRMGGGSLPFLDESNATWITEPLNSNTSSVEQGNFTSTVAVPTNGTSNSSRVHIAPFTAPLVQRELFPDVVQLKAHSSINLKQDSQAIFTQTTKFLTPCLQNAFTNNLHAYKATVEYSNGPDTSNLGVVVTYMNVNVVISVATDTIKELRSLNNKGATKAVHDCFAGPNMYQYLGSLRRQGVQVNEVAFIDTPFKSPIFANSQATNAVKSSQGNSPGRSQGKKSHVGLITSLMVGMVVIGAVFLAYRRRGFPSVQIPTDRLGHLSSSIRNSLTKDKIGRLSRSIRRKLPYLGQNSDEHGSSTNSEDIGSSSQSGTRERTWSGSFRRHPPGSIKPAALQKKPASSKDYLKSPRSDDNSFSISGDYNVPDEYDFQATPMSQMYGGRQSMQQESPSSGEDEFSMPEDYNTVHEDMSLYSKNASVLYGSGFPGEMMSTPGGRSSVRAPRHSSGILPNSFVASPTLSAPSSTSDLRSPKDASILNQWSMNSFTTSSPATTTDSPEEPSPYRHWDDRPRGSPASKLAMPRLS